MPARSETLGFTENFTPRFQLFREDFTKFSQKISLVTCDDFAKILPRFPKISL